MELVSVSEAHALILSRLAPLPMERRPLEEALGLGLASPIRARDPVPPFDTSAMDGYALRAADTNQAPVRLRLVGLVRAGTVWPEVLRPGQAVQILTGAPLPPGADAVAEQEIATVEPDGWVRIREPISPGRNIRKAGEDMPEGATVLEEGLVLEPAAIAAAAAAGWAELPVRRRARVAILITGDELVDPGSALPPGKIRNSNRYLLEALCRREGAEVTYRATVRDDPDALQGAFEEAHAAADLVLSTGGVSVGVFDYVQAVLEKLGFERVFWRVRQRPGKPLLFGLLRGKPFFGLPGNPVSAGVCFDQYVRPALRYIMGLRPTHRARLRGMLEEPFAAKRPGLYTFVRARWRLRPDGRIGVRPTGPQGSHLVSSLVAATCLLHLPEAWGPVPAETEVELELWATEPEPFVASAGMPYHAQTSSAR
ncbi:MAG: molybdopterin molybdotransferase MoeA [Bacteroidetes bacterium]|nr:molybdopterin molybdotransferase MoeA [Rhodothermia bacterium]MCS7155796.1 molybdopterin molybdotransferase MoeA [Bacteroidota bacterium]MCX7906103.1 molybdopterin molybdotransferase MoeA [Bacteroidota bacterium]MDW8138231.1 molybdopterin molybdotransferase MoeA [Bacteroidota bacterium]MDW8285915.1 molybdopterin molybdotransferase MoeA [Bacteroidota bacterium]